MPFLLLVFVIVKLFFTTFDTGSVTEGARRATGVTLPVSKTVEGVKNSLTITKTRSNKGM